jgi:hypothetical protein
VQKSKGFCNCNLERLKVEIEFEIERPNEHASTDYNAYSGLMVDLSESRKLQIYSDRFPREEISDRPYNPN